MRWMLAALLFALAVGMAIATAALRAENLLLRHEVERSYRAVAFRVAELKRLRVERLADATPERLAATHWQHLHAEAKHRQGRLQ
jgi:hypothetical protein